MKPGECRVGDVVVTYVGYEGVVRELTPCGTRAKVELQPHRYVAKELNVSWDPVDGLTLIRHAPEPNPSREPDDYEAHIRQIFARHHVTLQGVEEAARGVLEALERDDWSGLTPAQLRVVAAENLRSGRWTDLEGRPTVRVEEVVLPRAHRVPEWAEGSSRQRLRVRRWGLWFRWG